MELAGQSILSPHALLVVSRRSPIRASVLSDSGQAARRDCSIVSPFQELLRDTAIEQVARSRALEKKGNPAALLIAGLACTMSAPQGQLYGRAGRKCHLEDGERYLERAIAISGEHPILVAALCLNYNLQRRGKESLAESYMCRVRVDTYWDEVCSDSTDDLGVGEELGELKKKLVEMEYQGSNLVPTTQGLKDWLFCSTV